MQTGIAVNMIAAARICAALAACAMAAPRAAAEDVLAAVDGSSALKTMPLESPKAHPYMAGFTLEGGEYVCRVSEEKERKCGVVWGVALNQKEPVPVRIRAEGRIDSGDASGDALIYVDVSYVDGGHLWGQKAFFPSTPCGWCTRSVMLMPAKPIRSISVYLMARSDPTLRARFRSPVVEVFGGEGGPMLFDGIPMTAKSALGSPCFLLRDARAGGGFCRVDGDTKGVRVEVKRSGRDGAEFFEVSAEDLQGGDRALTCSTRRGRSLT